MDLIHFIRSQCQPIYPYMDLITVNINKVLGFQAYCSCMIERRTPIVIISDEFLTHLSIIFRVILIPNNNNAIIPVLCPLLIVESEHILKRIHLLELQVLIQLL